MKQQFPWISGIFILMMVLEIGGISPEVAHGQFTDQRYQLGKRLARFERGWQSATPERRKSCVEPMEQAVSSFFSLKLDAATRLLDIAFLKTQVFSPEVHDAWIATNAWSMEIETPWIDPNDARIRFRIKPAFSESGPNSGPYTAASIPSETQLRLVLGDGGMGSLSLPMTDALEWQEWQLNSLHPGDFSIQAHTQAMVGSVAVDMIAPRLSVIPDLKNRLAKVELWYETHRRDRGTTRIATARSLAKQLLLTAKGNATEIDLPWSKWLRDWEVLGPGGTSLEEWIASTEAESRWMTLSDGQRNQSVRLAIPQGGQGPWPVLIALHGAGGSENMFFETYGAGRLIELARNRSWLVVSPRQTLGGLAMNVPQILDALEEFLPIDRQRIGLVGHSMGAAQAIAQVSAHPDQVQAVVALGGGGNLGERVDPSQRDLLREIPFWVAAGDQDFGRRGAVKLANDLREIGATVEYRTYDNVEHMVIVQAALDDVFEFLDDCGSGR